MNKYVVATLVCGTESLGQVPALEKTFSTGSTGFYGNAKIIIDGEKYQCSLQLVKIGSKPVVKK